MSQRQDTSTLFDGIDAAAGVLVALQLSLAVYVARHGATGRLPVHFDIHGAPNGWGDRGGIAIGIAVIALVTLLVDLSFVLFRRRRNVDRALALPLKIGRICALAIPAGVTVLFAVMGSGKFIDNQLDLLKLMLGLMWLSIAAIGSAMGKLAPNHFAGLRLYWTFHSRLAWEKANRMLGRIYFVGSLVGLIATPFVEFGPPFVMLIAGFLAVTIGGVVVASYEAWRVWRNDAERTS